MDEIKLRAVTITVEAANDVAALRKAREIMAQDVGALAELVGAGITIKRTAKGPAARNIEVEESERQQTEAERSYSKRSGTQG